MNTPPPLRPPGEEGPRAPTFEEALWFWLRLGCISFGGPAGQIAVMHRELVETRRWVSESQFLRGLNFCMFLPGPEAQQLATYLGWRLHGIRGGIAAGALFVLPSMFVMFGLSWLYVTNGDTRDIAAMLHGLQAAVIAVVFDAIMRIGSRSLRTAALWLLAAAAFVAIQFFGVSFVWIVAGAAMIGFCGHKLLPGSFPAEVGSRAVAPDDSAPLPPPQPASTVRALKVTAAGLALWCIPMLALVFFLGWESTAVKQGLFFSKVALVTFGGAYAVLPYVAQQAVENFGWLTQGQMMTGLALAETTPGPLVMVLQFVGFLGSWEHPGRLEPMTAAIIGSLITTWVTFLPSFIFVLVGAPHVEHLGRRPALSAALTAITAAVVGVILTLAVTFASYALVPSGRFDWPLAIMTVVAFQILRSKGSSLIAVIIACAAAGWVLSRLG
jgi:chromate transporter